MSTFRSCYGVLIRTASAGAEPVHIAEGKRVHGGHTSGIDLTFSAPKSVSVLSYADDRIEEAFTRAMHNTLSHVEGEFARTRSKIQSEIRVDRGEALCFSTFTHRTSRELDPQLHAHCVLMNMTRDENGRIKALLDVLEQENPGLILAGSYRQGISVSDSIASGEAAALRIRQQSAV